LARTSEYPCGWTTSSTPVAIAEKSGFEKSLTTKPIARLVPVRMLRAATFGR
jgi:hypothetical protein